MTRTMNFAISTATIAAIAATALSAQAERSGHIAGPAGSTMWYSDQYSAAFYSIDKNNAELVATILPGPAGGNSVVIRRKLNFNDLEAITINGTGENAVAATLLVKHSGADILSRVRTESLDATKPTN